MTTRQRIIAALERRRPDRVPVSLYEMSHLNLGGWYLGEPSAQPLLDAQRELGDSILMVDLRMLAYVEDQNVIRDASAMSALTTVTTETIRTPKGDLTASYRIDPGVATRWQVKAFIDDEHDIRKFLSIPVEPHKVDISPLTRQIAHAGQDAFVEVSLGDVLGYVSGMFHYDRKVMLLMEHEDLFMEMLRVTSERLVPALRQVCSQVKGVGFRFWGAEGAGAPLMNPRRYFGPLVVNYTAPLIEIVNASGNYSIVHCHGRLNDILEPIADMRPHALEPLEVLPATTADVSMADVKRRIGSRVCLMGGIQAAELETLPADKLAARVLEVMSAAKGDGGYVMLPTGTPIQIPISPKIARNYRTYFETARQSGDYP